MDRPQNQHNQALIAGIDEAGRGCLAGPVAAAAVILPPDFHLPNLKDSKLLSPKGRLKLQAEIKAVAISWGLGLVWHKKIDELNILQATFHAMAMAVKHVSFLPSKLLIDGNMVIPTPILKEYLQQLPEQVSIIGGDKTEPCISAASILAKTFRDKIMARLHKNWPEYGFEKHKGYGTKQHYQALALHGPSPVHRLSFKGVTERNIHGSIL